MAKEHFFILMISIQWLSLQDIPRSCLSRRQSKARWILQIANEKLDSWFGILPLNRINAELGVLFLFRVVVIQICAYKLRGLCPGPGSHWSHVGYCVAGQIKTLGFCASLLAESALAAAVALVRSLTGVLRADAPTIISSHYWRTQCFLQWHVFQCFLMVHRCPLLHMLLAFWSAPCPVLPVPSIVRFLTLSSLLGCPFPSAGVCYPLQTK